jgi:hypothetical protein
MLKSKAKLPPKRLAQGVLWLRWEAFEWRREGAAIGSFVLPGRYEQE